MIILDTHAWIWWSNGSDKLSSAALQAIESTDLIGIPAICCWEVAMLISKGRLKFNLDIQDWLDLALSQPKTNLIPLTPQIAVLSTRLHKPIHGDPADRLIIASGLALSSAIISKDKLIQNQQQVQVIW